MFSDLIFGEHLFVFRCIYLHCSELKLQCLYNIVHNSLVLITLLLRNQLQYTVIIIFIFFFFFFTTRPTYSAFNQS